MSHDFHRSFLEREALRAAPKAIDRRGPRQVTAVELLRVKVRTVEPWKRVVSLLLGLVCGFFAFWLDRDGSISVVEVGLGLLGSFGVLVGLFGFRRPAEAVGRGLGDGVLQALLDALLH